VAEATAWLERLLHDGPRPSGEVRRDAEQAGLSPYYLSLASDALAVQRLNRGRHSSWALPQHHKIIDHVEKRCDTCGEIRPSEDFRRPPSPTHPRGKVVPACSECTARRSRRTDKDAAQTKRCSACHVAQPLDMFSRAAGRWDGLYPSCRPCRNATRRGGTAALAEAQVDRAASFAPDSAPAVALRVELVDARRAGQSFSEAWPSCMAAALAVSADREADDWRDVLLETHAAWRAAFERTDAMAGHGALATLAEAA
jgi:hypothetical protein